MSRPATVADDIDGVLDRPTRSWALAFDATDRRYPTIIQHLLLGINAHINLDLGIAAARTAPGTALPGLRRDFDRINEILASLVATIQGNLDEVSPLMGLANRYAGGADDEIVKFSINVARREAWRFATELAPLPPEALASAITVRDGGVARIGGVVLHPGHWVSTVLLAVRFAERARPAAVIDALGAVPAPSLATVERRLRGEEPRTP